MITTFINGLFDGLMSLSSLSYLIKYRDIFEIYFSIIVFNLFSLFYYSVLLLVIKLLNIYSVPFQWLVYLGWRIPMYVITFIYNIYYTNQLFSGFVRSSPYKWSYTLVASIYNNIILFILNIIPFFLPKYIYLKVFTFIYSSLINSFYCHRIYWEYRGLQFRQQLYVFEGNLYYHLGYGCWLSLLSMYFDFYNFHHMYSLLYPLFTLNTIILNIPISSLEKSKRLFIFQLPIYITNKLLYFFVYFINTKVNER